MTLVISVCSQGMDCNRKKKGTVWVKGKMGETTLTQWERSNVLHHFISYFFYSCWFDFSFWLLKTNFQLEWSTANWTKQLQWKPFSMEDVRNLKTLGLAQNNHMQISTLLMFEIKTEFKRTFLKHLNVAIHLRSGCHFFLWAPYWRVLLSAVFLLPVGWMASC